MVTMTIRNKYELTFKKLFDETIKDGGEPDTIEIDPPEAWKIFNEIRDRGMQTDFKVIPSTQYNPLFQFRATTKPFPLDQAQDLVRKMAEGMFFLKFMYAGSVYDIKLVPKKKPDVPEPVGALPEFQSDEEWRAEQKAKRTPPPPTESSFTTRPYVDRNAVPPKPEFPENETIKVGGWPGFSGLLDKIRDAPGPGKPDDHIPWWKFWRHTWGTDGIS